MCESRIVRKTPDSTDRGPTLGGSFRWKQQVSSEVDCCEDERGAVRGNENVIDGREDPGLPSAERLSMGCATSARLESKGISKTECDHRDDIHETCKRRRIHRTEMTSASFCTLIQGSIAAQGDERG